MVDNAVIFGANKERAEQELKESLEFEAKLAEVSFSLSLHHRRIQYLLELYSFISDFAIG